MDSVNLQRMAQKLVFPVRLTNSKSFCSFLCHYFWVQNIFLQLACHRFMGQHGEKMKSTAVRWARGIFMESMVNSLPAIRRLRARQSWNLQLGAALTHEWGLIWALLILLTQTMLAVIDYFTKGPPGGFLQKKIIEGWNLYVSPQNKCAYTSDYIHGLSIHVGARRAVVFSLSWWTIYKQLNNK